MAQTQTATDQSAVEIAQVMRRAAADPLLFQTQHFWTLPGPDDDETEPRLCEPWEGVQDLATTLVRQRRVIGLKSRKVGFTTFGLSTALWVAMFRSYSRAHLFSYRDEAAKDLLDRIHFAHGRLPPYMRMPLVGKNAHTLSYSGAAWSGQADDIRTIQAFPTTEDVSADLVCDFALVDEAARIRNLHQMMAAIEPTVRWLLLVISSGKGPLGDFAEMYRAARNGNTDMTARFYPWTARPGRDQAWRDMKLASMAVQELARREYPETEDDAFLGLEDYVFPQWAVDQAHDGATGLVPPVEGHAYVHAWDIGKLQDWAVGTVLDITEFPYQVVAWERYEKLAYPVLQNHIERVAQTYPGQVFIENNGPGEPVIDNLDIVAHGQPTTPKSKVAMISDTKQLLESGQLKWKGLTQLDREMAGYMWDDRDIVQDCVMSLAIAVYNAPRWDPIGVG